MKKGEDKKIFINIANQVGSLVQEKNEAYGDSFSKSQDIVKILFPDGVKPYQYRDMLAVTRVIDKLFRIATNKDAFGESPWRDICGYAILGIANDEGDKRERQASSKAHEAKTNAELWDEQHEQHKDPRVNTVDTVRVIPPHIVRQLVVQKVRDRKDEGHGNPYANIDEDERGQQGKVSKRDTRFSYDNSNSNSDSSGSSSLGILNTSEQALLREAIVEENNREVVEPTALLELFPELNSILKTLEQANAEGNKEKEEQALKSFDHWNKAIARADKTSSE